jgi:hypothetical protein
VLIYVMPLDQPGEFGGVSVGESLVFTSDFVIRESTELCGPNYSNRTEPVSCELFVHEFPDGLSAGRWAIWAFWTAPCSAWVDMGLASGCDDPDEVVSHFASGVDSPFEQFPPPYGEVNGALLSDAEREVLTTGMGPMAPVGPDNYPLPGGMEPVDASGASPNGGSPRPDYEGTVPGDDGTGPLPLGTINELPSSSRLDFLYELCNGDTCFRDAIFVRLADPTQSGGPGGANEPFHIPHGFVNDGTEPLGEGFDLVFYATPMDLPGEFGGISVGQTRRYTSDYVMRSTTDECGPTYRSQDGPQTCEWFVHDISDGLPAGRWAMWASWEAPCWAWLDLGFTDTCADPDEISSMFASGVDSPFGVDESGAVSGTGRDGDP